MKIIAVTSCPTGIAHTYMAAEALEKAAKQRGHNVHVETQGSAGVDKLSAQAIADADVVVFAADAAVHERERFAGKPAVEVGVSRAINRPAEVIEEAEQAAQRASEAVPAAAAAGAGGSTAAAPATHDGGGTAGTPAPSQAAAAGPGRSTKGGTVRQWLMTGVSYMIPFVTAGGILIALAFMFGDTVAVVEQDVFEQFSVPALLFTIGATAFAMIAPILAGFIAYAMADRPGIAPGIVGGLLANEIGAGFLGALIAGLLAGAIVMGLKRIPFPTGLRGLLPVLFYPLIATFLVGAVMILVIGEPIAAATDALTAWLEGLGTANAVILGVILGAMMAFDMGGPVNKVAYFFGVGLISAGVLAPMAAVMAAGMTPPLGLALATTIRKRQFNQTEREAGKAAWVMGASFITEGAIPFAAADPIRVIPALIVGSAVTGGLSMAFNATLQAPHGGVFVFGLVGNWPLYLLAIAIGTLVTAAGVLLLKSFGSPDPEIAESAVVVPDTTTKEAARA
jgi:fructose PTS system EIIBC or EIIC component